MNVPAFMWKDAAKVLKEPALDFFKNQLKLSGVPKKGRRYPLTQRSLALALYFKSPRCYRFLSEIFALPTSRMIRCWLHNIRFNVGWNDSVFQLLKRRATSMKPQDKVCGIVFDAISLKSGLHYNSVTDKIDGFEDLAQYHSNNCSKPAQFAMVFMLKGLCSKWKQALGYFLFQKSITASTLKLMITDCAKKVMESGLSPKFVVCDQDPSNTSALRMLGITPDKSYFQINQHKIHMFFDTPHLMKSIRNTLSKYDIEINLDIIKWKYIEQFYKTDKEKCIKLAPKLTDSHIYFSGFEKMRVKLATQVFSRTVASALYTHSVLGALPPEAAATATFIQNTDELFDVFNSAHLHHFRSRKCAISDSNDNLAFLDTMETWLNSWKVIANHNNFPCIDGWLLNINSLKCLWQDVKENHDFKFLLTNRINQDCLENFFAAIRNTGGSNDSPTTQQFIGGIKNVVCNNLLKKPLNSNCTDDSTEILEFLSFSSSEMPCNEDYFLEEQSSPDDEENGTTLSNYFKHFDPYMSPDSREISVTSVTADNTLSQVNTGLAPNDSDPDELQLHNYDENSLQKYITSFNPYSCCFESEPQTSSSEDSIKHLTEDEASLCALQSYIASFNPYDELDDGLQHTPNYISDETQCHVKVHTNAITYIGGYVCHKLLLKHKCSTCQQIITNETKAGTEYSDIFLKHKEFNNQVKYLTYPSQSVVSLIKSWEHIFSTNIEEIMHLPGIRKSLRDMFTTVSLDYELCPGIFELLVNIYLNMRLFYHIKFKNRAIRGKRKSSEFSSHSIPKKQRKLSTLQHT